MPLRSHPGETWIPARSRRQAMDWSLVLLSQSIANTIDFDQDFGWALIVDAENHGMALDAIRLYRLENKGWPWQKRLRGPDILFDWGSLAWVLLIVLFFWLDALFGLRTQGVVTAEVFSRSQWWRLFTATWLHADLGHLASNAVFGVLLLGLAMGRYGTGAALLAAYCAAAIGNLATCWIFKAGSGLGSSGMVMGALGLVAAQSVSLWRSSPLRFKYLLSGLAGGTMLFALLGLSPGTNVLAHFSGFVAGLLFGALLAIFPSTAKNSRLNLISGVVFTALVIVPWVIAIRAK